MLVQAKVNGHDFTIGFQADWTASERSFSQPETWDKPNVILYMDGSATCWFKFSDTGKRFTQSYVDGDMMARELHRQYGKGQP